METLYQAEFDHQTVGSVMGSLRRLVEDLVVDARRLVIVARKLADNALYHSGQGGGWCIVGKTGERLVVTVRDEGVGIHATMRKVFPDIDEGLAVTAAFSGDVTSEAGPIRVLGLMMVLAYTETGANLLLETGGLAFVGIDGRTTGGKKHTLRGRRDGNPGSSARYITAFLRSNQNGLFYQNLMRFGLRIA